MKPIKDIGLDPVMPDGGAWIYWNGGIQPPVPRDTHTLILHRNGRKTLTKRPQWLAWTHSMDGKDQGDIIAYQITRAAA